MANANKFLLYVQTTIVLLRTFLYSVTMYVYIYTLHFNIISERLRYCIYIRSILQGTPDQTHTPAAPTSTHQLIFKRF
jgi:hypothetical protein